MPKAKKEWVSIWKRIGAYLIDAVIIFFVVEKPLSSRLSFNTSDILSMVGSVQQSIEQILVLTIITGILTIAYWSIQEYAWGQTIGKALFRIKVASTKKKNPNVGQIIVRNLTKVSFPLLVLDTIYLLFQKNRQRLFEQLSNTHVVEEDQ